jgi:hydroxymethylbilane synthase
MVSAVGQGAIGIEIREDDAFMQDVCARLADPETMTCVTAERVVMRTLEGGCQVPIGAYARMEDGVLVMDAIVGSVDGSTILRTHLEGDAGDPVELGQAVVEKLLCMGAAVILSEVRDASVNADPSVDSRLET